MPRAFAQLKEPQQENSDPDNNPLGRHTDCKPYKPYTKPLDQLLQRL